MSEDQIQALRMRADAGDAEALNELAYRQLHGLEVPSDPPAAVRLFEAAARAGHLLAKNDLARCYIEGIAIPKDLAVGVRWLTEAADQGLPVAQLNLAHCYRDGLGVTRDEVLAESWLQRAADRGHPEALWEMGGVCERKQDGLRAFDWYMRSAQASFAPAQFDVGRCLQEGIGVTPDPRLAIHFLRLSAAQSYVEAAYRIGLCYEYGTGVTKNENEAALWYRRATDGGHRLAQAQFEQLQLRTLLKLNG